MKKFVTLGVVLMATLALTACKSAGKDVSPAALLPENSVMTFVVDFSDGEQRDNFSNLMKKFPKTNWRDNLIAEFNSGLASGGLTYDEDIKPILEGEWASAMGLKLNEEDPNGEPNIYVVARIEEDEKFRELIVKGEEEEDLVYSEEGDYEYWTNVSDMMYAGRLGEYFFVSSTEEGRKAIVANLESDEIKDVKMAEDKLAYLNINMAEFVKFLATQPGMEGAGIFEIFGPISMSVSAESDGFAFNSSADFSDSDAKFTELVAAGMKKLSLIDRLNGDGTIVYSEQSGLGFMNVMLGYSMPVETTVTVDDPSLRGTIDDIVDAPAIVTTDEVKAEIADFFGITPADVVDLINSNIAFRMGYTGENLIPEMGLFVDISGVDEYAAAKIVDVLDVYMKEVEAELMAMAEQEPELKGALKKDVVNVAGGGLHRLSVDTTVLPEEVQAQMAMFGLQDPKLELYYGMTGDDVFVISFGPDFAANYGKETLADDEEFKAAVGKIGGTDGSYAVSYLTTAPMVDMINDWVVVAEKIGAVSASDKADIDLYVNRFLATFKYLVSVNEYEDDVVTGTGFLKIEKVEVEEKGE